MEQFECIELDDQVADVSVVRFKDKKVMDPARIERLGVELLTLVDDGKPDHVLINFEDVNFFSSAAINKLIILEKRVKAREWENQVEQPVSGGSGLVQLYQPRLDVSH